jgi:AbrB family looped-hinge helix DNA binding protein
VLTSFYTNLTSKGQMTLPAPVRRGMGLAPGGRVRVQWDGQRAFIDPAPEIGGLRARARREAEAAGTWGRLYRSGDGFTAQARQRDA